MLGYVIGLAVIVFFLIYTLIGAYKSIKRLERRLHKFRDYENSEAYQMFVERQRQITEEKHTIEGDHKFNNLGELIGGSAGYLESYLNNMEIHKKFPVFKFERAGMDVFAWTQDKREQTPQRRKLIKAGALILAELDRIKDNQLNK